MNLFVARVDEGAREQSLSRDAQATFVPSLSSLPLDHADLRPQGHPLGPVPKGTHWAPYSRTSVHTYTRTTHRRTSGAARPSASHRPSGGRRSSLSFSDALVDATFFVAHTHLFAFRAWCPVFTIKRGDPQNSYLLIRCNCCTQTPAEMFLSRSTHTHHTSTSASGGRKTTFLGFCGALSE